MRRFGVVFTHTVAYKGISIACKRNTLTLGLEEEKSLFVPTCCLLLPRRRWPHRRRTELSDGFEVYHLQPIFWSALSDPSSCQAKSWPGRCRTCSLCVSFARLFILSFFDFDGFVVIFPLIHGAVPSWTVKHKHPIIFKSEALWRCTDNGNDFRPQSHPSEHSVNRSIRSDLWFSITKAVQESVQYGFVTLFLCFLGWDVSVTCTVRWTFLDHVVWNGQSIIAMLVQFLNFVWRSQACSASTVYNAFRPVCHTIVALYFGSDLANLEVLHVSHAGDHFLRLLAEWIERVILLQGLATLLYSDASRNWWINLWTFSLRVWSCSWGSSLDPEVNFTASAVLVRYPATSFSVLARMVERGSLALELVVSWRL